MYQCLVLSVSSSSTLGTIFISFHNYNNAIVNDSSSSVEVGTVKFPKTGKTENGANEVREGQKGENTSLSQDDWP
jgi:hypothetical protein